MVSAISWVLKLLEVKITNAIHNEAIDNINKKYSKQKIKIHYQVRAQTLKHYLESFCLLR